MNTPDLRFRPGHFAALLLCVAGTAASAQSIRATPDPDAPPPPVRERWTVAYCGTLLPVAGKATQKELTLIVRDGLIHSVVQGYATGAALPQMPADAIVTTLDLKDSFVLPGLIDCHVHLTFETSPEGRLASVTQSEADQVLNGVVYARRTIDAGFTTVRDVGSAGETCFSLRDAINDGKIVGPRIMSSGESITPTGGHGDGTNSFRQDVFAVPGPIQGVADGVDACRQAVRTQVKIGADCIKLTATGGVLSNIGAGLEQQFFDDELKAIVETAHLLKKKVAAHAHGVNGINAALRAGVDSIEHGTFLDEESIRLFKEKGAYYVPTITAGRAVLEYAQVPGYYIGAVVRKAEAVGPLIQQAFAKAHKAGVKIAFGTDAGVFPHGTNAKEFVFMTEAGMSPSDCLVAATINAADLLGLSEQVGTLEKGKAGDFIAVKGDPLADIRVLLDVPVVVKGGAVVKGQERAVGR